MFWNFLARKYVLYVYFYLYDIHYINFPFSQNLSFLLHTETQNSSENALLEENSIKFLKDGNFEAQRKKINKNFVL